MSYIHGYFKIVSLCYRNSSVCWFCCEPGVFLPAIPLYWLGRRQSKNALSGGGGGGGAELEKRPGATDRSVQFFKLVVLIFCFCTCKT